MPAIAMLMLGLALGALLAYAGYAAELRRFASFLSNRDRDSNARATLGAGAPGTRALADAINKELDATTVERVDAHRHADEFRRDLSALSHDIRTPLMGAKGYLQLASEEPDEARRGQLLASAATRLDDVNALLDQLFAYTKATDPDLACELSPTCVPELVEEVLVGHYPEFEGLGWEPEVDLGDGRATIAADPEALRRIVENLVTNALRHGADAPRVTLQEATPNEFALTVANTVEDPAAVDPSRLFERFYQSDPARRGAGSGLGLATSAKLAEAMGMRLEASLEGDVLAITLTMPRG